MKQISINGYKRITKPAARKHFNNCESYYMLPCNIRPGNPWIQAVEVYDTHNSFAATKR